MKKYRILMACGVSLLVIGVGIIAAPHIAGFINEQRMKGTIDEFDEGIAQMYEDTDTSRLAAEIERINSSTDTDYTIGDYVRDNNIKADEKSKKYDWALLSLLKEQMEQYNVDLIENGQAELNDPFSFEQPSFLLNTYSISDNVFGHISAPSIKMDLPIYLGANQYNMNFGAVHLSYSSMPIGGRSTNSVFAAHRGYIGKIFFDNIVFLKAGDDVYITNPWEKLHYKVTETAIISPYDIEQCYIQEGRSLITLLTCHPYGSNEFRYMVVCEQVNEDDTIKYPPQTETDTE